RWQAGEGAASKAWYAIWTWTFLRSGTYLAGAVAGTLTGPRLPEKAASLSTVPSASVTSTNNPPLCPVRSRSGNITTVTSSPALRLVDFHPWRRRLFGLFSSIDQSSRVPAASGTDIWMKAWGLVHWNSVTLPFRLTRSLWSNMAKEWCAATEPAATSPSSTAISCNFFIPPPTWSIARCRQYILRHRIVRGVDHAADAGTAGGMVGTGPGPAAGGGRGHAA